MKNLICVFALVILPMMLYGQSAIDLKKDSLEVAQLRLKIEKEKLTRELNDLDKKAKDDATTAQLELYKAQKELIGGTAPTPLTGSITISKGDVTMAETRALVHRSLDKMIKNFVDSLKYSTCYPLPCDDKNKQKIIIYNNDIYQAFPDYEALIEQLKILKSQYEDQKTLFDKVITKEKEPTAVGGIAIAKTVIESLTSLATLFRTETEFKVNEEVISEEVMVSKFRMFDDCCSRDYIYPALFPPRILASNLLLTELKNIDAARNTLENKIKDYVKDNIEKVKDKVDEFKNLDKEINDVIKKLDGKKVLEAQDEQTITALNAKIKKSTGKEIVFTTPFPTDPKIVVALLKNKSEKDISGLINNLETNIKDAQSTIDPFNENIKKLNDVVGELKTSLNEVIDEQKKTTLLRKLLVAESILKEIQNGAYTLRLTASSIGTNRIRKNLIFSTLKHSAFTEINFMLFKDSGLIKSSVKHLYIPFRKVNQ